jgi:hypothetical protein
VGLALRLRRWSSLDRDLDRDRVLDLDRDLDLDLELLSLDIDLDLDRELLWRDFELDLEFEFLDLDLDRGLELDRELFDEPDELELGLGSFLALRPLLSFLFFPFPFRLFWESSSDSSSDLRGDLLLDFRTGFLAFPRVSSCEGDRLRGGVLLSSRPLRSSVSFGVSV